MSVDKYTRFADKISTQMDAWEDAGHDRKAFLVDPGKFGRLAATKPLEARWKACTILNAWIQLHGTIRSIDVEAAFLSAGLS